MPDRKRRTSSSVIDERASAVRHCFPRIQNKVDIDIRLRPSTGELTVKCAVKICKMNPIGRNMLVEANKHQVMHEQGKMQQRFTPVI